MTAVPEKGYVAGGPAYHYPAAGDSAPPGGAKVLLLTRDGICVDGPWCGDGRFLGWAPLPRRDKDKEARIGRAGDVLVSGARRPRGALGRGVERAR